MNVFGILRELERKFLNSRMYFISNVFSKKLIEDSIQRSNHSKIYDLRLKGFNLKTVFPTICRGVVYEQTKC